MRFRLTQVVLGAWAAGWLLAAPAAHAFTIENGDSSSQYGAPKFDLEEQAKNFRAGGTGSGPSGKNQFETPIGNGTLQFGVQQGPVTNFSMTPGLGSSFSSRAGRADFERMVTPESLR
jgi:hypothetical protein